MSQADETKPVEETKGPKIDPSETKYFPPATLQSEAAPYCSTITAWAKENNVPFFMNFDENKELPANFGILVQPVQKRDKSEEKLVLTHLIIAAVPDIAAVQTSEKGAYYLREILREAFGRRLKSAVVTAVKTKATVQLPDTLDGFIESIRRVSPLYTFNQLQEQVRKSLEKKEVKVSKEMLQGILMSASFAEQVYPNTKQGQWELVLDRMIAVARTKSLDPAILEQWKGSRAEATFSHEDAVDFSDLDIG